MELFALDRVRWKRDGGADQNADRNTHSAHSAGGRRRHHLRGRHMARVLLLFGGGGNSAREGRALLMGDGWWALQCCLLVHCPLGLCLWAGVREGHREAQAAGRVHQLSLLNRHAPQRRAEHAAVLRWPRSARRRTGGLLRLYNISVYLLLSFHLRHTHYEYCTDDSLWLDPYRWRTRRNAFPTSSSVKWRSRLSHHMHSDTFKFKFYSHLFHSV